ncbi:hypothetical protein ALC57_12169 [Trachymyrmex cornetzi]|uniref:HAT C-terminal dimerisation domain-containing protein n=1 Tax=Trachymyrmex cornetzi TaxID=471704 RepID=A0A195DS40_9HYME|nr:hypothetical protein ALC57_12169 [Trachymyrmex cornetzi]
MFLGFIAPTITVLRDKLKHFTHLTYCKPLAATMISSLEKRFKHVLDLNHADSRIYILSAISLSRFKLNWVPECYVQLCKDLFLKEMDNLHAKNAVGENKSSSSSSGDEDFFRDFMKKNDLISTQPIISSSIEALSYLELKSKDLCSLVNFPNVKKLFFQYNTSLSSSAPVERLFSIGQQIYIPRRNRLSDGNFEKLLFLKNKDL